jgi:hypothetical protein
MTKRIQNIIAESRYTLPITAFYSIGIWLIAGLVSQQWWIQFGCFVVSALMMMFLNKENMLIRIYSRLVSSAYLVLSCAAVFLFASRSSAIMQMGAAISLFLLWHCYQDKKSVGWTFYTFLCLGAGSIVHSQVLYYLPIFWIMMAWFIFSLSWRTFFASLLGLITPYWFCLPYYALQGEDCIELLTNHLSTLLAIVSYPDYSVLNMTQLVFLAILILLMVIGSSHFIANSYKDTIRVREIYYSFITTAIYSLLLVLIQPQCYDMVIHVLILVVSPMIAHFFALTHSRFTNILFIITLTVILLFTGYNLWISSFHF